MKRLRLLLVCVALHSLAVADVGEGTPQVRIDYMLNCQGCHLPDGSGFVGKVPDFRGMAGKFLKVEGGREFLVRVPGAATAPISDERLATLLTWMVREFSATDLPADFVPYSAAEVGDWRRKPYTDVVGVRAGLMARIEASAAPSPTPSLRTQ